MRNARFLVCFLCIPTLALAWDADILITFKRSVVRRDPSSALASWGRGDYCSWNGIRCARDASVRWVDAISITSAGLEFSMWEGFGSFPRLRFINFSSNRITGAIPWNLGRLKSLVSLDLSFNGITGSIPSSFNDLPLLEILVLRNNAMRGAFPSGLCGFTKLRVFDMGFNKLTGLTADLGACMHLEVLVVENNNIDFDVSRIPFSLLKKLRVINIGRNRFKGVLTKDLGRASAITVMRFNGNQISGQIPGALGLLSMLTILDLSSNQLNDPIPETLGNLALLEDFSIAQNRFAGRIPSSVCNLAGLTKRLDLSRNKFSGIVPMALGGMKWVKVIDLSRNMLSGGLPSSLGGCESLLSLDLSFNKLSGSIPPTWISLVSLNKLELSSNALTGEIPPELGQISTLKRLDLSKNELTGSVPSSLADLPQLEMLDLSSNLLSGKIPDFPLCPSLRGSSFAGNPGLCGAILNVPCKSELKAKHAVKKINLKELLINAQAILLYLGMAVFGCTTIFIVVLMAFRLCYVEKYESVVDCIETHCSVVVCFLHCFHLTSMRPRISLRMLKDATDNFKEDSIIGRGSRGIVYKAFLAESIMFKGDRIVAAKRLEKRQPEIQNLVKECRVLRKVRNANLVKVVDWLTAGKEVFVIMDFYANGDLQSYLHNPAAANKLEMIQFLQIAIDIAQGIAYLHKRWWKGRIIHCNLNLSHILLDHNLQACISGLRYVKRSDLAKFQFEESEAGRIAPECLAGGTLSQKAEVYSYGIFLLELITRKKPVFSGVAIDADLHMWVQRVLPLQGLQIVDPTLLNTTYNYENVFSLIFLALSCTEEVQDNRPEISDVITTLKQLKTIESDSKKAYVQMA